MRATRFEWAEALELCEELRERFMTNVVNCREIRGRQFASYGSMDSAINASMIWRRTPEGHDYWANINTNLLYRL
jgi:hypothetical protein